MSLEQLLKECRARHIILLVGRGGRVRLWSPGVRVNRDIRAAINRYNRDLARMIARSEIYVCPSPSLHKQSWDWITRRFCCDVCAHLVPEVARVDELSREQRSERKQKVS